MLREFLMNNGLKNPTLARHILLWVRISGTVHPRGRQRTDGGNCNTRGEVE